MNTLVIHSIRDAKLRRKINSRQKIKKEEESRYIMNRDSIYEMNWRAEDLYRPIDSLIQYIDDTRALTGGGNVIIQH